MLCASEKTIYGRTTLPVWRENGDGGGDRRVRYGNVGDGSSRDVQWWVGVCVGLVRLRCLE